VGLEIRVQNTVGLVLTRFIQVKSYIRIGGYNSTFDAPDSSRNTQVSLPEQKIQVNTISPPRIQQENLLDFDGDNWSGFSNAPPTFVASNNVSTPASQQNFAQFTTAPLLNTNPVVSNGGFATFSNPPVQQAFAPLRDEVSKYF
jgi:hypothetical protein